MTTRSRLAIVVSAIAGLASLAPAAPAASWLEPVELDTPVPFGASDPDPIVSTNARGDVVAAWELDIDQDEPFCCTAVRVAYRPAGGATSVQTLPRATLADSRNPSVGIDAAGNGFVAWEEAVGNASAVMYAVRAPGATSWDVAEDPLAGTAQKPAADVVIAVAAGGAATFAWRHKNSPGGTAYLQAVRRSAGGSLGTVDNVTAAGSTMLDVRFAATLATTATGDTTAAWLVRDSTASVKTTLETARAASGDFGAPAPIASQLNASFGSIEVPGIGIPKLALDSQARAVLLFTRLTAPTPAFDLEYAVRDGSSVSQFQTDEDLDLAAGDLSGFMDLAVDSQGNAAAVWSRGTDAEDVVEARFRPADASFGQVQTVSDAALTASVDDTEVAFDAGGTAIAVWSQCIISECRIQSARRPPAGEFGAVDEVTETSGFPRPKLVTDGDGNAVTVFNRVFSPGPDVALLSAYDGGPPQLSSIAVPAAGQTGKTLSFSTGTFDVWSPVTVKWTFGDGASATGKAATHAYSAPGAYTVTITAEDAAGHTASATRPVQVTTPPPPPPPPPPSGIDGDGDGFTAGQDCNDGDPAIRPGATEIRGNTIDENCDGRAQPFPTITSPVSITWGVAGDRTKLIRLKLRQLPAGAKVQLRCKGPGCPFKRKSGGRVRSGRLNALKAFGDKRIIRAGAVLEVRITAPDMIGKVVRYKTRDGKPPKVSTLCLRPGARTPQRSC